MSSGKEWVPAGYRAIRPLGEGSGGRVVLGAARETGEPVCVKWAPAGDLAAARAIRDEFRVLAALRHPCLPGAREYGAEGGRVFLAYGYREGEPLDRFRFAGRPEALDRLARGLLSGISVIHAAGLVHYDLSPANVIVGPGGGWRDVRLIDLGLAGAEGAARRGTPGYLAPELALGSEGGRAADVYGAGILLAAHVLGKKPFDAPTQREIVERQLTGADDAERELRERIGPERAALLRRMIDPEPKVRGDDAFLWLQRFEDLAGEGPRTCSGAALRAAADAYLVLGLSRCLDSRGVFDWEREEAGARKRLPLGGERLGEYLAALARSAAGRGYAVRFRDREEVRVGSRVPVPAAAEDASAGTGEEIRAAWPWDPSGSGPGTAGGGGASPDLEGLLRRLGLEHGSADHLAGALEGIARAEIASLPVLLGTLAREGHLRRSTGGWVLLRFRPDWVGRAIRPDWLRKVEEGLGKGERREWMRRAAAAAYPGDDETGIVGPASAPRRLDAMLDGALADCPETIRPRLLRAVHAAAATRADPGALAGGHRAQARRIEAAGGPADAAAYHRYAGGRGGPEEAAGVVLRLVERGRLDRAGAFVEIAERLLGEGQEIPGALCASLAWVEAERRRWEDAGEWLSRGGPHSLAADPSARYLRRLVRGKLGETESGEQGDEPGSLETLAVAEELPAWASGGTSESVLLGLCAVLGEEAPAVASEAEAAVAGWGRSAVFSERHMVLRFLGRCGNDLQARGSLDEALALFQTAERIARAWGMALWQHRSRASIGLVLLTMDRDEEARRMLSATATARESMGDLAGAAGVWVNLGLRAFEDRDIEGAVKSWERQDRVLMEGGAVAQRAASLGRLACAWQETGDWPRAEESLHSTICLAEAEGLKKTTAIARLNLANQFLLEGRLAEAERSLESCRGMAAGMEGHSELLSRLLYLEARVAQEVGGDARLGHGPPPLGTSEPGPTQHLDVEDRREIEIQARWDRGDAPRRSPIVEEGVKTADVPSVACGLLLAALEMERGAGDPEELVALLAKELPPVLNTEGLETMTAVLEVLLWLEDRGERAHTRLLREVLARTEAVPLPGIAWRRELLRGLHDLRGGPSAEGIRSLHRALTILRTAFSGPDFPLPAGIWRRRPLRILARRARALAGEEEPPAGEPRDGEEVFRELAGALLAAALDRPGKAGRATGGKWERGIQRILSVTETLNSTKKLEPLLNQVVDSLLELCGGEHGFVVLLDEKEVPTVRIARGVAGEDAEETNRVSRTAIDRVFERREAILVRNALDDEVLLHQPSVRNLSLRSLMCAPLIHKGALLGALYVDNCTAAGRFTEDDLRLLEVFANQAAVAIENTKLFSDLENSYRALSEAHERIVRSERLKVLGEMASGVAHDFNNLLTAILVRAQLLQLEIRDGRLRGELSLIEKAAMDGANAIRRIQDFTRMRTAGDFTDFSLREAVADAVEFTKGRWGRSADGETRWRVTLGEVPDLPVRGNVSEMREVFTNIILNAIEAMPEGGEVRISAETGGEEAVVAVEDEGTGMPKEVRERIFDPFYSTKGRKGNGLGLSVAAGIVDRHGGTIRVESEEGKGSRFLVSLPRAREVAGEPTRREGGATLEGLRVLVVDDEATVLAGMRGALESLGCRADLAADAEEALEKLGGEEYDVVLTDHYMPGMTGLELVSRLREEGRTERRVVMTGSTGTLDEAAVRAEGADALLRKPFTLAQLREILRPREALSA